MIFLYTGIYKGTTQLLTEAAQANAAMCEPGGEVTFRVRDGRFKFPWYQPSEFHVRISYDGSFYAISDSPIVGSGKLGTIVAIMQGHVVGMELIAYYGTRSCRYRLTATRS
jgi:hypothetical protein